MPKSYRRKRTSGRRRRTRKKSRASKRRPFAHSRGKKYGAGFPAPVQLRLRAGGFPPLAKTRLRYCYSVTLDPRNAAATSKEQLVYHAVSTNSLVAPQVAEWKDAGFVVLAPSQESECYMHHDDYSQVYSNYRVTGSKITIAVAPEFTNRGVGPHGAVTVPTYVTLQNSNCLPGAQLGTTNDEMLDGMASVNCMKSDGKRFIKIQPWVMNAGADVASSGKQSRTYATTAWSSKWIKHGTDPEFTQAPVDERPNYQQYFIISACGGEREGTQDPAPVRVQVTLEATVTYWRKRVFNQIPLVNQVRRPTLPL